MVRDISHLSGKKYSILWVNFQSELLFSVLQISYVCWFMDLVLPIMQLSNKHFMSWDCLILVCLRLKTFLGYVDSSLKSFKLRVRSCTVHHLWSSQVLYEPWIFLVDVFGQAKTLGIGWMLFNCKNCYQLCVEFGQFLSSSRQCFYQINCLLISFSAWLHKWILLPVELIRCGVGRERNPSTGI